MWLLSTSRAELHYFHSPESIPGGYAILSHVWDPAEQSFQDTREHCARCKETGANPRDLASVKVKESCILAEEHGYQWIWNDTCCIDKTSSADLSEAINSMFLYYSLADVCFAYLRDVPARSAIYHEEDVLQAFRNSCWHERGWTLQELVAPPYVLFINTDWQVLGSKAELADILEDITKIPMRVLRLESGLEDISVAERMSWASQRRTTRVEDEAYCLLGIFSINMPTLYGEGRRAFQRLQEEIMKNFPDTTLFAWGNVWVYSSESAEIAGHLTGSHLQSDESFLFAPAPSAFRDCGDIHHIMPTVDKQKHRSLIPRSGQEHIGVPTFSITPHGILARIPTVERLGYTVGVFSWFRGGTQLGLLFMPSRDSFDPRIPRYNTGISDTEGRYRLVSLGDKNDSFELFGKAVSVQWREVYIAHRAQPGMEPDVITRQARILMSFSLYTPFRFVQSNVSEFIKSHGNLRVGFVQNPVGWTGAEPAAFSFEVKHGGRWHPGFQLRLGRCMVTSESSTPRSANDSDAPLGSHWARIAYPRISSPPTSGTHDCATDHIDDWPDLRKTFDLPPESDVYIYRKMKFASRGLTVSCTRYPLRPDDCFVVKLSWK